MKYECHNCVADAGFYIDADSLQPKRCMECNPPQAQFTIFFNVNIPATAEEKIEMLSECMAEHFTAIAAYQDRMELESHRKRR